MRAIGQASRQARITFIDLTIKMVMLCCYNAKRYDMEAQRSMWEKKSPSLIVFVFSPVCLAHKAPLWAALIYTIMISVTDYVSN